MVFTTFALSFATKGYGLDRSTMLLVPVASNTLGLIAIRSPPCLPTGSVVSRVHYRCGCFVLVMFPYRGDCRG